MASRRDQLHSYQFMNQRVVSAFVMRETDPAQSPLRRGIGALFGGLMVAVLVGAVYGIIGLLTKVGTDTWKSDGSVVVERESGASFVYLNGRLNPALNLASAKLAAGRPNPTVFRVAAKSLTEAPRGTTIGIPGAPASLPEPDRRSGLPWTMCALAGDKPWSVLLAGSGAPAASELGDRGMLVKDAAKGMNYLVWHGRKYQFQDSRTTIPALFGAVSATPVGTAWLDAMPSGVDIAAIAVPDRGAPSGKVPGRRNGEVLVAGTGSGEQSYLVFDDGLAPITALQRAVLDARFPGAPVETTVNAVGQVPVSNRLDGQDPATQPPAAPPELASVNDGETLCAQTRDPAEPPVVSAGGPAAALAGAVPTTATTETGRALADAILVPAGRYQLVKVPGSGGYTLVTDLGVRYPIPGADVLALLGYPASSAIEVPTALVNRIPAGVTLDPAAAILPAAPAG
ncbi:type VII secretion protein EccB [Actinoplanes campanulatus]|uniref:Type VII secretion protein EccB n=1 Tax=Actinoplanes campanulatus TaxID=113559 RepID=A0A7W5AHD5_9ACTN|nr:type VII secretion protein EccB [Actinoplanes campanulatus]MBB3096332.1 type VII secretion protein EccB [Actinoplanes campanulatus]GGN18975.1 type VII secretion protein EccB [Actinoplanes campanulatus]GID42590.1 type VII secretion protein EccB [Actinoplanes campanulatus]